MKKITLTTILVMVMLFTVTSFADNPPGSNKVGILYLFEKTPPESTGEPVGPWPIVPNGAWGSLSYNLWGPTFDFVFHGRRLVPGEEYTLIYYPDEWPGKNLICFGSGFANGGGNLLIKGRQPIGTNLPAEYDKNWTPCGQGDPAACLSGAVGAKIWLVLSDNVKCEGDKDNPPQMTGWTPTEYLFEYNLINFELRNGQGNGKGPKK